MGYMSALGMAASVGEGLGSFEQALSWHLASNHYPPVPASMVPVCMAAIAACEEEEPDRAIELAGGMTWRGGPHGYTRNDPPNKFAPAHAIVAGFHLEAFIGIAQYCAECDCADLTVVDGLADDCDCECHGVACLRCGSKVIPLHTSGFCGNCAEPAGRNA